MVILIRDSDSRKRTINTRKYLEKKLPSEFPVDEYVIEHEQTDFGDMGGVYKIQERNPLDEENGILAKYGSMERGISFQTSYPGHEQRLMEFGERIEEESKIEVLVHIED
jgi:hypothetical protein